jgi:O-antigen ligase/tetratricopeptide (TPR) repeat protein
MIYFFLFMILIFGPMARGAVNFWALAVIQILILIMAGMVILKKASLNKLTVKRTPMDLLIAAFLFIFIMSAFKSKYLYGSIMEIVNLSVMILLFYAVVNFMDNTEGIRKALNVIVVFVTGLALAGIFQHLGVIDNRWWSDKSFLSGPYVNHNHFAGLIELVMPVSMGMALYERDAGKKSVFIYSFMVLLAAFLLSMSRGGWFSLSVSMLFMVFFVLKKRKTRFVVFMLILSVVIAAFFIFRDGNKELIFKRILSCKEVDLAGRFEIWKGTIQVIRDNFLLGTGPGTFIYNFPRYRPDGMNVFVNYAHNDYLQAASEMGIFALGLIVFIIYRIIRRGILIHKMSGSSFKKWIPLALAAGILSLSIHGLSDFNFHIPANAALFTVFSGFIFSMSPGEEKKRRPFVLNAPAVLSVICLMCLFIGTALAAELCSVASGRAMSKNEFEKSEKMALFAGRICPFNHTYPYKLAKIYAGNAGMSEGRYRRALSLNPIDAWSWIGLADAYNKLSLDNKQYASLADAAYIRAVELDPANSYYLKKAADFLLASGNVKEAAKLYKKAAFVMSKSESLSVLPADFSDEKYYMEKATLSFLNKDVDNALLFYKMTQEFQPQDEDAKLGEVRCYFIKGDISRGLRKYKSGLSGKRAKSALFASIGGYCLRKGRVKSALKFAQRCIAADPQNPEGYDLRYFISRRIDDAFRILDLNAVPVSVDKRRDGFTASFDIKEGFFSGGAARWDLVIPRGMYEIKVIARGREAVNIWPHMTVRLNGKDILASYVANSEWKDFGGIVISEYPRNWLEISYDNDYYDPGAGEDRNLYIDKLTLETLN